MNMRGLDRCLAVGIALAVLAGCATTGGGGAPPTHSRRDVEPRVEAEPTLHKAQAELSEDELLDVWVELFDPGELPENEKKALGLSMDTREAEARYMPVRLRDTMEKTGYWGAVRVVPRGTEGAELLVRGLILVSDGQRLTLQVTAEDATGRQWFDKLYRARVESDAYQQPPEKRTGDPFEQLYFRIANDLAAYRKRFDVDDVASIRRVAELRFAMDMAPETFDGYLLEDDSGRYTVSRLPARDDPMYQRVARIRERDNLLIDVLNGHYDNFFLEMDGPYTEWRKARTFEMEALQKLKRGANARTALGVAAILGAILVGGSSNTRVVARDVMVIGGSYAVKRGIDMRGETSMHRAAIEELGESFATEARPLVVEVDGEVHELTGSAEAQYAQWRDLLREIHATETGLPPLPG